MNRKIISASLLFSLSGLLATPAYAEWEIYKFLDLEATATDNLQLGLGDELVFSVRPSVELEFKGNRFDTEIDVGLAAFRFIEREDDIIDPQLELTTTGELIDNLLFLSSSLALGKVIRGVDFLDLNEDADSQGRFLITPFISRQLGQSADLYLGFSHQSLDNELDGSIDFQENNVEFLVNRNPRSGGVLWGVGGNFENLRINGDEDDPDQEFDSGSLYSSLGYTIREGTLLEVIAGLETNDFTEINNDGSANGFLEGRVRWTPSERTSLVLGYSDRFFGEGLTMSFSHRVQNSIITAGLTREVSNADVTLSSVAPFAGEVDLQAPTDLLDTATNATGRLLFVDERFNFSYKLAGRRSDFIVDAIYSDQEQIGGDATRTQFIGRIAFDRQLSPLTTLRLQYEHVAEDNIDDTTDNENRVSLGLLYNFDRKERTSILSGEG